MVDILAPEAGRGPAPALSATSDAPMKLAAPPVSATAADAKPAAETKSVETPKAAEAAADSAAAVEASPEPGDEPVAADGKAADKPAEAEAVAAEVKPAKKPISERFSEVTAQRRAEKERADNLEKVATQQTEALARALQTIEQLTGQSAQDAAARATAEDPRPKRETFDTPDAYDTALVDWAKRESARAVQADTYRQRAEQSEQTRRDEAKRLDDQQKAQAQEAVNRWQERRAKALEEMSDFAEVAEGAHWNPSPPMIQALLNADNGPQVAYYLGKHPDRADEICKLNPVAQVLEMGKLAAELARSKPTAASKAPPPIKPLASKAAATERTIYDIGNEEGPGAMNEYAARRNKQLAESRRH